jgi:hypothetical protein
LAFFGIAIAEKLACGMAAAPAEPKGIIDPVVYPRAGFPLVHKGSRFGIEERRRNQLHKPYQ